MRPAGPILPSLVKVTEELHMFAFDDGVQNVCTLSVLTHSTCQSRYAAETEIAVGGSMLVTL